MAKAKKRVATRKKKAKRSKASAKTARKKTGKRTAPKKASRKVRRSGRSVPKSKAKKKQSPKAMKRKAARKPARKRPSSVVEIPVETEIVDIVEEAAPGVFVVTEYGSVRIGTPTSPGEAEPDKGTGPETKE
jgi:hypothetical protein